MTTSIWSRVKNLRVGNAPTLQRDLKKVTDSGCMDIPTELLDTIVEASAENSNRCEIMTYLRECLAGPTPPKQWRRVYGALVLIEDVMRRGDQCLLVETAEGHHFDVIQRLSFLEHFDNPDKRAQGLVRSKASAVRTELVPKLQNATAEGFSKDLEDVRSQGEASTCANSVISRNTTSTDSISNDADKPGSADSSPQFQPTFPVAQPTVNGRMVLNGIVSVGHSEDTTDESSGDEGNPAPVQYRQAKPWKQASLQNEEPRAAAQAECVTQAAPQTFGGTSVQSMDLLDL